MEIKIDRNTLLWGVIAVLFLLVLYTVFFQGDTTTSQALSATSGQAAQAYSGGMVGGC